MPPVVRLQLLGGSYAIARLPSVDPIPAWADGEGFVSISRTDDELSTVCLQARIPSAILKDEAWSCFKLVGPFAFDATGIVLSVIEPLSTNDLGIFVVSTFDGDHLMVKAADLANASRLLADAGHVLI